MPTIVELPDKTEIEFPEGMDDLAIHREIVKFYPHLGQPVPTERPAIPEPGTTKISPPTAEVAPLGTFPEPKQEAARVARQYQPSEQEIMEAYRAGKLPTMEIGTAPATLPRFGAPGTVLRGASEVAGGLGEWALNRPEEVLASIYPPTSAAVGMRYGPTIAKQAVTDAWDFWRHGDQEAGGRLLGLFGAITGPVVARKGMAKIEAAKDRVEFQKQYTAFIDQEARNALSQTVGEFQKPLSQVETKPALLPKTAAELAANEQPVELPKVEEGKPPVAAPREAPQTEAPTAETVSVAKPPAVTAAEAPPAISQPTTEPETAQVAATVPVSESEGLTEPSTAAPAEPLPAKVARKPRKGVERPWDIIDEIAQSVGKIRNKKGAGPGLEGYYSDAYENAKTGSARDLFSQTGQSPDEVLDTLRRSGFMSENATVDDLWDAINKAKSNRTAIFRGETPEAKADKFQEALKKQVAKRESQTISVGDLAIGEKFRVGGEDFEVVAIDPDTGEVTVKDGRKFGAQTIPDGADVSIEKGSLEQKPPSTEFVPEEKTVGVPKLRSGEKGTGDLLQNVEQPFNLVGEKVEFVPPKTETTQFGGETLTQNELFAIQKVVEDVDPVKSANVAQELYGGPQKAAQVIRRQLSIMDADPKVRKDFGKEQRARLKEVLNLLEQRSTGPGIVGMGGATAEEFTGAGTATAMKYRKIDEERIQRGLEPLTKPAGRADQEVWDRAMAAIDADPGLPDRLISELRGKARPITDLENHVLLLRKIDLRNDYGRATRDIAQAFDDKREEDLVAAKARRAELSDKLTELEEASRLSGSERGRALRSLRVMADEEFNLAAMEADMRASVGGRRLTPQEMSQVERIKKEYDAKTAALDKQLEESERRRVEAETRATLAEVGRQAAEAKVPPPQIQRLIEKVGQTIRERADAARERLKGKLFTLSPEVLKDLAEIGADNIWTLGEDFAKWSGKMIADIGERVRPYLQTVWEASRKLIDDTWNEGKKTPKAAKEVELAKQTVKKGDTPEQKIDKLTAKIEDKFSKGKQNEIAPAVQRLARAFVEKGIREREKLIDAVHGVLEKILPDFWTRRMTMDAISGYGDYKALTKDEISVKLRDLKGQMQQMAKLEDMAAKQAPLRTGLERRVPTRTESELIKLVNEAKRKGGYETTDPEKQLRTALDEVKKRTETAILDYEKRIRDEDFTIRKLSPIRPDTELLSMQADLKRIRKQWEQLKRENEIANRRPWQKALDKFVRWERAFKLSSPVVFGKLTAAALTRLVTTATEEAVGAGLGILPGIRTIAKGAPREGGINVPAMAKALTEAVTKGMKDAWETARTGASNLDVVYGEKLIDQDWANVFGQLHGMLKAPVKRFEFRLSLEKRIKDAIRNGLDVSDPLVMTRLSIEALGDGYRSIFMQRGFSSDMFNMLVTMMEKSKKYQPTGEISARMMRFLMPVVRVPANIVSETATGIYGAPLASARMMLHISRGTLSTLEPAIKDAIMRQFKKGSIGLGLMAIGYFTPEMIGGYDWREKRLPGAAKTGGFQIAGVDIPRWMTHAPWFELMQFGATIRHVKDQHVKGEEKGISDGMWAAGLGLLEETPFIGQMVRVDKMFEGSAARTQYLGQLMQGTLVPQALNKIAQIGDTRFGEPIKRKPSTVMEHVKMAIPGLRQTVPESTRP